MAASPSELVIISGASRGYGKALASAFASAFTSAHLLLFSRSSVTFEPPASFQGTVSTGEIDLAQLEHVDARFRALLAQVLERTPSFSRVILVHNAGSLGPMVPVRQLATQAQELKAAIDSNVTSTIILTSVALEVLLDKTESFDMVDISSGAARRPSATWASYCSTKAARYMFMQVLAAEETSGKVRALSYGPGVLATDMQQSIQRDAAESAVKAFLGNMLATNQTVPLEVSANQLVSLLQEPSKWTSGGFVDFYEQQPAYAPK